MLIVHCIALHCIAWRKCFQRKETIVEAGVTGVSPLARECLCVIVKLVSIRVDSICFISDEPVDKRSPVVVVKGGSQIQD